MKFVVVIGILLFVASLALSAFIFAAPVIAGTFVVVQVLWFVRGRPKLSPSGRKWMGGLWIAGPLAILILAT